MRRASPAAALAAGDDPMQPVNPTGQIDRTQQRLAAQKPNAAGDVEEKWNAFAGEALILDRRSKPDMRRPSAVPRGKASHQMRALREQQPVQMRSAFDQRPEPVARSAQAVPPLEHIRHRCAEDAHSSPGTGCSAIPTQRLLPSRVAQKAPLPLGTPHIVTGTLRPDLGVAVVAGRGNLRTTPPRVERVIRPFDGRVLCHEACRVLRVHREPYFSNTDRGVNTDVCAQHSLIDRVGSQLGSRPGTPMSRREPSRHPDPEIREVQEVTWEAPAACICSSTSTPA